MSRDSVAGRQAVVARVSRFGQGRLGTRLHVFVLVALFKAGMGGRDHLDRFLDEAGQYAATVKGGLASGALAVAVAVLEPATADAAATAWARTWATGRPATGHAPACPVLVDVGSGRVTCPEAAPASVRELVAHHVVTSVAAAG